MTENYRAFFKLLNNQQNLYPNKLSLITHQLVLCDKWKKNMKDVEDVVYSFAMIPELLRVSRQETNFHIKLYFPSHRISKPDSRGRSLNNNSFYCGRTKVINIFRFTVHKCFGRWFKLQFRSIKPMFYRIFNSIKALTSQYSQVVALKEEINNMGLAAIPSGKVKMFFSII
jgi:hypothetical protein